MKVWLTKYALTLGIFEETAIRFNEGERLVVVRRAGDTWDQYYHGEGKDWHRTQKAALERAEQMRVAKIASHRKSIAKLEKMTFKVSA